LSLVPSVYIRIYNAFGSLCDVNPTLNRDPRTAMPFLEADHLAENNNAIAVRTVPESELRSARGITWARFFTIEPAVDVTAVAAEKVRGFHALHLAPRVVNIHLRVLGANRSPHNRTLDMLKVDAAHLGRRDHLLTLRAHTVSSDASAFFKTPFACLHLLRRRLYDFFINFRVSLLYVNRLRSFTIRKQAPVLRVELTL
jgi:hypothetical protein